jgi:hypothetical protein
MIATPATIKTKDSTTVSDRMADRMDFPAFLRHPKSGGSRRLRVSQDLNISLAAADKLLYGERAVNLLSARVVESDLRAGDHDAIALWIAPQDAALMGSDVPHLVDALVDYDRADAAEEAVQAEIGRKPVEAMTDAELEEYRRAVAKECYKATRALAAIRDEQKRRQG